MERPVCLRRSDGVSGRLFIKLVAAATRLIFRHSGRPAHSPKADMTFSCVSAFPNAGARDSDSCHQLQNTGDGGSLPIRGLCFGPLSSYVQSEKQAYPSMAPIPREVIFQRTPFVVGD
jgi:hypothetical protein